MLAMPRPEARIEVIGLSVDFPLYHGTARSLKKTLFSQLSGRMGSDNKNRVVVQAVRDVSFSLRAGDRLGLVGGNGAGKTTLLRTLAGIFEPMVGTVRVQGSLNALLDPNLGMNPDLTGRENIMLRGLYAGQTAAQIRTLEEDVRAFAQLDAFMDLPVRIYSSGMIVRLGFALATSIRPQVLLMDEWFLAGDAAFMDKAQVRLETLVQEAKILVLSTHMDSIVRRWATRVIWLDNGRVRKDGAVDEVLDAYLAHAHESAQQAVPIIT